EWESGIAPNNKCEYDSTTGTETFKLRVARCEARRRTPPGKVHTVSEKWSLQVCRSDYEGKSCLPRALPHRSVVKCTVLSSIESNCSMSKHEFNTRIQVTWSDGRSRSGCDDAV